MLVCEALRPRWLFHWLHRQGETPHFTVLARQARLGVDRAISQSLIPKEEENDNETGSRKSMNGKRTRSPDCPSGSGGVGRAGAPMTTFLLGIDNAVSPVRVDLKLLASYDCRTAKQLLYDEPAYHDEHGNAFYYSYITRATIIAFLKSLTFGRVYFDSSISYAEMLEVFEYEGLNVCGLREAADNETKLVSIARHPPMLGVCRELASGKQPSLTRMDGVTRICEQMAAAIAEWPRLAASLESSMPGQGRGLGSELNIHGHAKHKRFAAGLACTPTRCWLQLVDVAGLKDDSWRGGDLSYNLSSKKPFWLALATFGVGVVWERLVRTGVFKEHERSYEVFCKVSAAMSKDPLGPFLSTRVDIPSAWRSHAPKQFGVAETWMQTLINDVVTDGEAENQDYARQKPDHIKFARTLIAKVYEHVMSLPRVASMFSDECCDEKGGTPERTALSKALKTHHIRVVRWGHVSNGLVFPPLLRNSCPSGAAHEGPCLLLEFTCK